MNNPSTNTITYPQCVKEYIRQGHVVSDGFLEEGHDLIAVDGVFVLVVIDDHHLVRFTRFFALVFARQDLLTLAG